MVLQIIKFEMDAEKVVFLNKCWEKREDIVLLFQYGFFDFKGGQGTIDRDKDGILQSIKINDIRYKRKKLSTGSLD